ncbi:MAG TPA: DUF533 domain-containing protein [Gemmatimonadales bacterium]|nr:DUF533 domain-containing protein [Gemmatimonadales bacterium]
MLLSFVHPKVKGTNMTESEQQAVVAIALLATVADGRTGPEEKAALQAALGRLGGTNLDAVAKKVSSGDLTIDAVAKDLVSDESRRLAYQTAMAVCHADGAPNPAETAFLTQLRGALGLKDEATAASAPAQDVGASLDDFIQKQAMIAAALELLPDRLANIAIIPVQLRMVYQIGQRFGQQLDANQVKDLAGTLGIGVTAQLMEGVVRGALGGIARSIFGGLVGGATELATGSAVTFASTYALGHVAKQYYSQGRKLSADDLRALFGRFRDEAQALFPKLQDQIQAQSKTLNLQNLLSSVR